MARTLAYANPDVLRWARESAGFTVQEAAARIGIPWSKLEMAEDDVDYLTLRQAEKAAQVYERPLAALLLPAPPAEPAMEAQFRRLSGAPEPPWPPAMRLLVRRVRRRQQAAAELYEDLEETPPWSEAIERFRGVDPSELADVTRDVLGVTREAQAGWAGRDAYAPLRGWITAVEAIGTLVMQDGSMELDVMRGFASVDDVVPAIVVNSADDPRARAFTVLHELGHLVLRAAGTAGTRSTEQWANDFAGSVMLPHDWLAEEFHATSERSLIARVDAVAHKLGVTPLAVAVRLQRTALLPRREAGEVIGAIKGRRIDTRSVGGGGDYYRRTIARFGPTFIRLVLSALDSQAVTYPTASTLLDNVRVNNFERLRDTVARREARR